MHKALVIAGIILVVVSKILILKSLFEQGAYESCIENNASLCASAPFPFFIYGWIITAAGAAVLIYGLKYVQLKDLR
ncbi:MAG TPA: hypothetical protein VF016_05080 [Nitrososphaera sp.]|jgi:hypothetical protein|nr:hypothetical protein [uncultured Nitrososphaera sp.]